MKGYTIQESIELLEKAVENGGGSGGASTAADVSFDNTGTGLSATNVQNALVEIYNSGINVSTTETLIGKWGDEDLFAKLVECGDMPNNTTKTVDPQIANLKAVKNVIPIITYNEDSTFAEFAGKFGRFSARSTGITIITTESWSGYGCNMILWYTKTTPAKKTKKK